MSTKAPTPTISSVCPCGCHSGNKREVGLCQQATGGRGRPKKKNNNKEAKLGDGTMKATVNLQKPWWYLHNADLGGTFRSHVLEFCGLPPGTPKICPNCEDRWKRQTRKQHGAAIKEQAEAKKAACRWAFWTYNTPAYQNVWLSFDTVSCIVHI